MNMKEGGSTKLFFEFAKFLPSEQFELTFIDTDYFVNDSLSTSEILKVTKGFDYKTVHSLDKKFRFVELWNKQMSKPLKLVSILFYYFLELFIAPFYSFFYNERGILSSFDFIYFVRNSDIRHFKIAKKTITMGSTHLVELTFKGIKGYFFSKFYSLLIRRLDGIHFFTELYHNASRIKKNLDLILPNGFTASNSMYFKRSPMGKVKFLSIGRLEPSKGIPELLEAFSKLESPDIELHICGKGSLSNTVKETSAKDSRVHYYGYLPESELQELYDICDYFIFPTHGETFGLVSLEAISHGLHVLASYNLLNLGTKSVYQEFQKLNWMTFVNLDPFQLKNKIQELANNIEIYRSKRAVDLTNIMGILSKYEWSYLIEEFYSWVRDAISQRAKEILAG